MTRRRLPTALPSWVARHKALVAFCLLVGAYYLWICWSSGNPFQFGEHNSTDYYNLLSDGFLDGHLSLSVKPDPQLLALPNPYDPVAGGPFKIHDLSLYHDKYYLYWGPVPALLAFIPFRILQLGELPQTLAVFVFSFVGFCFSIACLRLLARRFVPDAPRWMLGVAAVALALGNALPFTLRRVAVYEVAITAGFCFAFIALYLIITGLQDGPKWRRLALASLFIGLGVGSRPTMIVWGLGLFVIAVILVRRAPVRREQLRVAAVLLAPLAIVGVLLMLYNQLRFGSPTEFGQAYQLAGYDPTTRSGNKVSYIPPGLWYYLLARPHLTLGFPFVHLAPPPLSYPFDVPENYDGLEPVGGMITTTPFILLLLLTPLALRGQARRVTLAIAGVGAVILLIVCFALWGATMRYEVDFATPLLIAAALVWLGWAARTSGARRRVLTIGGTVLVAWGAICGAAISFQGYYNGLENHSPKTWKRLQSITSPLPILISKLDGKPKETEFYSLTGLESDSDPGPGIGWLTFPVADVPVRLDVVSGSGTTYGLQMSGAPQQPLPKGAVLRLETPDTNRALNLATSFAPTIVPLHLRRGMNRIVFRVTGAPPGTATRLADVHIAPLP